MPRIFTGQPARLEWAFLILILVLAAVLRLSRLDLADFSGDQGAMSTLSLDMLHGKHFPLLGMKSSVGIPNAPMNVYVMALPFVFSDSPLVATGYVALLNVLAVGALFMLARRYYGPKTAIIAALLYAVNPYAIIYSRSIWEQDLLPLFVIASVGTGILGFIEGKRWAQAVHLPLLSITVQLHYAAFVLVPVSLILIVSGRRSIRRPFFAGLAVAVLLMMPFALGLAQTYWFSGNSLQSATAGHGVLNVITVNNAAIFEAAITVAGNHIAPYSFDVYTNPLAFAALAAAGWLVFCAFRKPSARAPIDLAIVAWGLVTPVVFTFTWTYVYQHYMIAMLPGALLVLAVGANDVFHAFVAKYPHLLVQSLSTVYFALVIVIQVYVTGLRLSVPTNQAADLGYFMVVRQALLAQSNKILIDLDNPTLAFPSEGGIWHVLFYNAPNVRFAPADVDVYPAQPMMYLSHQCSGTVQAFWLADGTGCYGIGWRGPNDLNLAGYTSINKAALTYASGTQLLAYLWRPDQGCLTLVWKVEESRLPAVPLGFMGHDHHFLAQYYDVNNNQLAQIDYFGWQDNSLAIGDTAIKSFCLQGNQLRLGAIADLKLTMITAGGAQTYGEDLFDADHRSVGTWVDKTSWIDISLPTYF